MVAVALVGFSVLLFSFGTIGESAPVKIETVEDALYWHPVDANNQLGPAINSTPQTKSESIPSGANPLTDCEDSTPEACLQGFSSPQTPGSDAADDLPVDRQINKTN